MSYDHNDMISELYITEESPRNAILLTYFLLAFMIFDLLSRELQFAVTVV